MFFVGKSLLLFGIVFSVRGYATFDTNINIKITYLSEIKKETSYEKFFDYPKSSDNLLYFTGEKKLSKIKQETTIYVPKRRIEITGQRKNEGVSDTFIEQEGYIKFLTVVSLVGYNSTGNPKFQVYSEANILKNFFFKQKDFLVIDTDENSVYDSDNDGLYGKHEVYKKYINTTPPTYKGFKTHLKPVYSNVGGGVLYGDNLGNTVNDIFGTSIYDEKFIGKYYFIATNDTSVQTSYVHDENIFGDLTISFSIYGLGFSVEGSHSPFHAEPLTINYGDFAK